MECREGGLGGLTYCSAGGGGGGVMFADRGFVRGPSRGIDFFPFSNKL
jgi:hypothetical protein